MRQFNLSVCFFLLMTFMAFACPLKGQADGPLVLMAPKGQVASGQNLLFRIRTQELLPPLQAVLNYRTVGLLAYHSLPMKKESEIEFSVILTGKELLPPGLEYYLTVIDGQGQIYTLPQQNPQQKPFRIDLSLEKTGAAELQLPAMDGVRLETRRADLAIRLSETGVPTNWSALRLTVDSIDVTQVAVLDGDVIRYSPETDFAYGKHSVSLEAMDADGNMFMPQHWYFTIPMSDYIDSASAQAQFDVEVGGLLLEADDGVEPDWKLQSNLNLSSLVESGILRVSFEANGWYTSQQGDDPTGDDLSLNNYLLMFEYGQQKLVIGDLQVSGTELLGESIARRGGLIDLNHGGSHLQSFLLRSNTVTGFSNFSGMNDPDQQLYGASLEQVIIKDEALQLKGTVIAGKNASPENYNSGTLVAGNKGEIYSAQLTSRLFDKRIDLTGEYSFSHFDADLSDEQDQIGDEAWRFRLAGRADTFDYGGGYKYLGQNFHSIVTPTSAANRAEYNLYGTKTYEQSSLSANFLHILDNIDRDPLQPLVQNSNLDLTYTLYKTDWPVFFINSILGLQDSTDEPAGMSGLNNQTETIGGGLTLTRESWNLVPSYYFTRFEDDSIADSDSQTHQFTLSLGLQPHEKISLSPSFSYSRVSDESTDVVNETWQGVLAGVFTFSPNHNLNLTFSGINSRADDGSLHTISYDTIGQYNWQLQTQFLEKLQKTVSVRGRYNRINDRLGSNSAEDYSVYLLLSFGGIPIQLL